MLDLPLYLSRFRPVRGALPSGAVVPDVCVRLSLYAPNIERYFELADYSARTEARKGEDVSSGRFVADDAEATYRHRQFDVQFQSIDDIDL